MKQFTPYFKTKRGMTLCGDTYSTMKDALDKYEEWARNYHITSAWIDERSDEPPYFRRHKVKLVGVLKKEVDE